MKPEELINHAFVSEVFDAARPAMTAEHDYVLRHGHGAEYVPDEYELYLMRVGQRLAALLIHCEQLSYGIFFMSNFRMTPAMARAGITRAKHLRYSIENYIIRTQTLYDLVLKLVDAVFHLKNADSQCRHATIVQNLKVKRTPVPDVLKPLHKKLNEFQKARHTVIHSAYQDDDLFRLESYSTLEEIHRRSGDEFPDDLAFLPKAREKMTRETIRKRKAQYTRFNSRAFKLVSDVLTALHVHFTEERRRLGLVTGRNAKP